MPILQVFIHNVILNPDVFGKEVIKSFHAVQTFQYEYTFLPFLSFPQASTKLYNKIACLVVFISF